MVDFFSKMVRKSMRWENKMLMMQLSLQIRDMKNSLKK